MAHRPHLDRNAYFVGRTVSEWNNLGKVECQIERIAFVTEGDGGMTAYFRDAARQEDEYLGKTNNPSLMG